MAKSNQSAPGDRERTTPQLTVTVSRHSVTVTMTVRKHPLSVIEPLPGYLVTRKFSLSRTMFARAWEWLLPRRLDSGASAGQFLLWDHQSLRAKGLRWSQVHPPGEKPLVAAVGRRPLLSSWLGLRASQENPRPALPTPSLSLEHKNAHTTLMVMCSQTNMCSCM